MLGHQESQLGCPSLASAPSWLHSHSHRSTELVPQAQQPSKKLTARPSVVQVPGSEAMLEAMSGADKVLNKVMRVTGIGKKIMSGFGEPEVSTAVPAL